MTRSVRCLMASLVVQVVMLAVATAGPRKVLVLPLDGNVDPAVRARLNATVQRLAKSIHGQVSIGDATYQETADAIGCRPTQPTCAETVRSTLGVDELVYGTVVTSGGKTQLVVHRVKTKQRPRAARTRISDGDPPERVDIELASLFGGPRSRTEPAPPHPARDRSPPPRPGSPEAPPTPSAPDDPPPLDPDEPMYDNAKQTRGVILASSGGLSLVIGLVLWSDQASTQDEIDAAPTADAADFERLEALERRAWKFAIIGDVLVVAGLAAGGYGIWTLYEDRQERRAVTITPQITATSAGVVVGGRW